MVNKSSDRSPRKVSLLIRLLGLSLVFGFLLMVSTASAATTISDINPNTSDNSDPDASTGGRVNGLAADPGNNQIFYAASEFGGLFKTIDGGVTWSRLDRHLPTITWDVEVDPGNSNRIYATSSYDGRVNSISGIQVSTDGGATWAHPASATPPAGFSCDNPRAEPAAFGISIRPDATQNVFIGTNCGVARSTDSGVTWTFIDPVTPPGSADNVRDVVVQAGGPTGQGIVDICGNDRHRRSTDGGATWTGGSAALPPGRCSIAVSPDESYVLFVAAADNNIYESDDGGATWTNLGTPDPQPQGRIPFVATNQRSDSGGANRFDLWFGDVRLYRGGCTTPAAPAPGGANRCPVAPGGWAGPFTRTTGAHDDVGDIAFDTAVAVDSCPRVLSSDGGMHRNTDLGADCQNPNWTRSNVGLHATWVWSLAGADRAGVTAEDLYFGLQDNGPFGTTDAGAASPTWHNADCCDVFDVVGDASRVLYTICCSAGGRVTTLIMRNPGMTGGGEINTYPPDGLLKSFTFPDSLDQFGGKQYVLITRDCTNTLTDGIDNDGDGVVDEADEANGCSGVNGGDGGVYITADITANPIVWTELGAASDPNADAVRAAVTGGTPTFYAQVLASNQVWKFTGTGAGTWQRIDNNDSLVGGLALIAVDPTNPNRLYGATSAGNMVFSNDGGLHWNADPELDNLMVGGGVFKYLRRQPTMAAFDPADPNIIVAGGLNSGVFLSTNGGQDWELLTDPIDSGASGVPHLPEPRFAYFDHEPAGDINVYIGTRGRGVWRFLIRLPVASAGGPYFTNEGTDLVLAGTATDPDGAPLTYAWDLDNDGDFDDALGTLTPTFSLVGQDGVYPVRLKASAGGAFTVVTTTVTVNNVAPSVSLTSNAPVDEGSAVTVSGTISDPGWLDVLTATIDWGDGTPIAAISGVLENIRPDATLTFETSHVYGDNGTFTATVCGFDDDTSTCQPIDLQIDNVDPTSDIDETDTVLVNGIPTFLAHAGEPLDFRGRSTDPGSDDLILSWDWDDGPPSPDVTTIYLVNPPNPDPYPSPSVQPRDVTDRQTHAFADACLYKIRFLATDDDGGHSEDAANVIIVGNADRRRPTGYWQHQFGRQGHTDFDEPTLKCYLAIIDYVSTVFNEKRDAATIAAAFDVLFMKQNGGSAAEQFDRELLTAWLNFANGAIEYNQLFDTNGDGAPDTPFAAIVAAAETVRLDPNATEAQLKDQKNILHHLNPDQP